MLSSKFRNSLEKPGHVTRRHAVTQIEAAQQANVGLTLGCVLTARRSGILVGGTAFFAKYSRDDERQTDEDAVGLVIRLGRPTSAPTTPA